ncbi:MAG: bifunctional proline dehydrogenase/L-glutamate gamma-semialdehyde dehydrogenase [Candidatus Nanopelagicales bacterium]|nr:bifunctional proline dehydrogenase/L-glutamate gamma-semialdehyde dehydrogenase [Candidatus Nanopelagicales bacterium]
MDTDLRASSDLLTPLPDGDRVVDRAVARASRWMNEAEGLRTRRERANRGRLTRLLRDPAGLPVTMALTDEVMRISDSTRAAATLQSAAEGSNPRALGVRDHVGLRAVAQVARLVPGPSMKVVHWQIRDASKGIILPAEREPLRRHLQRRAREGARLNINVLGEAVLGEDEARHRLERVIEMLTRPEVGYLSVKISAIAAQLSTFDHEGSVDRVAERLRTLYRAAAATTPRTFVNLDMEEYRDLALTIDAFTRVLDEPAFLDLEAGIVLQAYLPECHAELEGLLAWAQRRRAAGGAQIKIRIVKGANLAMESCEAQIHGWTPAPYASKAEVDASWKRAVDVALRPEHADAVRVGIASHNLFDLAWALEVAAERGVSAQVDIEMLEGMANAEALAIIHDIGSVLLYAPVTRTDDFASAVAYLVRRLDENTAPENFLRAAFDLTVGSAAFAEQEQRFRDAVAARHTVSTDSRRHAPHPPAVTEPEVEGPFRNEPELDVTRPEERAEIARARNRHAPGWGRAVPVVVDGDERVDGLEDGRNPGADGAVWYSYTVATREVVDDAVAVAVGAVEAWDGRGPRERARILWEAARIMGEQRHDTLAVMALDAGKTVEQAGPEIAEAIDFARFYGRSAIRLLEAGPASAPVGAVVVVPPWNFPYAIPAGGVLAALAAGNTVILKPAPESVATAWLLVQQLWQAGVPHEVLQFVPTRDDEVGQHLVTHPGVAAVVLTGSWATARLFTEWKPDLRLLAETSGKNALLISATADIDAAVKDLVASAFGHAGQKCSAASLAIVEASVYDNPAFFRQLRDAVTTEHVGPGTDPAVVIGPVIRPAEGPLHRALTTLDTGESWLVTPRQLDDTGHLWSPGVKIGVQPGSWSHRTEWFGPVLGVMRAPDFATAIAWQNDVEYGLTAGLHALDVHECETWIERIEAGNAYVNRGTTGAIVNRQPFGGWKKSAVGPTAKAGGEQYVACLRDWAPPAGALGNDEVQRWWAEIGGAARDLTGLTVERNLVRFRPLAKPLLVRVDADTRREDLETVRRLSARTGTPILLSAAASRGADTVVESVEAARGRVARGEVSRVRWLSGEDAGDLAVVGLTVGVSVDRRPIAGSVAVEGPRWMHEQSVCITAHRYGNVGAGPQPRVPGEAGPGRPLPAGR